MTEPQVIPGQLWTIRVTGMHGGVTWRVDRIEGNPPHVVLRAEGFHKTMSTAMLLRDYSLVKDA